ncbi:MAG: low molecular weight phosphatase family protein [Alphaproteobacteria bacterium]|nr:low molecular weight phosphatase family protein [Alphaproteobacteria bacterium]
MRTILFLCTGNYYRSRFAEEFFNFSAPFSCPGWTAVSRGIAVDLGVHNVGPIARSAAEALRQRGIDFDPHLARMPLQLKTADLDAAHHIVALKKTEHLALLQERFSVWLNGANPGRIEYWHIDDVDRMAPAKALPLIAREVEELMKRLSGKGLPSIEGLSSSP